MDTKKFEDMLASELADIKATLTPMSAQNPQNPSDWEAKFPDINTDTADKMDVADETEEYETGVSINAILEEKYREIEAALTRIKEGTYGTCEVGKEPISEERLLASPEARTCVEHAS